MKRMYRGYAGILSVILCITAAACNLNLNPEGNLGEVQVFIGGSAARSVNSEGLPVFDETNTRITITDTNGKLLASGTTSLTAKIVIGTKIIVRASITTASGRWSGSQEHIVTDDENIIALKLSKAVKGVTNLLLSFMGTDFTGTSSVSLSTESGKKLIGDILVSSAGVVTRPLLAARDRIGRLYVFYKDTTSAPHFKRFDVEGNEDTPTPFTGAAWTSVLGDPWNDIAMDIKTDTLFLAVSTPTGPAMYCTGKENGFTPSNGVNIKTTIDSGISAVQALAAYNGMVYAAVVHSGPPASLQLIACEATLSGSTLTLVQKGAMQPLPKLRNAPSFGNDHTVCTGLFADESGVYCLLAQNNTQQVTKSYAVGTLIRYEYSGGTLTKKGEAGLNPAASGTDARIPFDGRYFFKPIGFAGYDEENIYIADDGFDTDYRNENWHIKDNKNRIAAFNRATGGLSFSNTDATWIDERPVYKFPNTKMLLWEKGDDITYFGMKYWINGAAGTPFPGDTDALWASHMQSESPTDVFCYDQDGNLYILYVDLGAGNQRLVRRFALKEDGTYGTSLSENLSLGMSNEVSAIAADISDGENYLYYAWNDGPNERIGKYKWNSTFGSGTPDLGYNPPVNVNDGSVTALAANKDGVFAAMKYLDTVNQRYNLKVKKYKKADGSADGEITLVGDGIRYKDMSDNPLSPVPPGIDYQETVEEITGLQIVDRMLYAVTVKVEKKIDDASGGRVDVLKSSGKLYKVEKTDAFLGSATELAGKDWDDASKAGYGFYRFIAVMPKKLVIASDGAWSKDGKTDSAALAIKQDTHKVLKYGLDGYLQNEENAGGSFSKQLKIGGGCGFAWE